MRGTLRRRGQAWELRVYAGAGRTVTRTHHGTRREAERALARLITEVDAGRVTPSRGRTVAKLLGEWLAANEGNWSPSTIRENRRIARTMITPALGEFLLSRLTTADIDRFYGQLRRRLAAGSVRRVHGVLRAALEQGVRWGWVGTNPAGGATPPRVGESEITAPPVAVVKRLLAALEKVDPDLGCFVRVAGTTGTRRGQVLGLRLRDIDFDAATLKIRTAVVLGPDGVVVRNVGKTRASTRTISLGPAVLRSLAVRHARMLDVAFTCGVALPQSAYVFSDDPTGRTPWRPDSTSRRFRRARARLADAGRLHDLKHFAVTHLLEEGEPIERVAERTGTNPATLLRVYSHFIPGSDRAAAEKMDQLLE